MDPEPAAAEAPAAAEIELVEVSVKDEETKPSAPEHAAVDVQKPATDSGPSGSIADWGRQTTAPQASQEPKQEPPAANSREYEADEHKLTLAELAARYGTDVVPDAPAKSKGLTAAEAAARLVTNGKNRLTPPKQTPAIIKFLRCFLDPFMVLLNGAGALCFLAYGLGDKSDTTNAVLGGVLWVVVFLTCVMTFLQERQTSAVMDTFAKMLPAQCTVVRDGRESRIMAEELVIGDIVRLGLGDRVPADVRLVDHKDLKVEMSSMTGEPDAIACSVDAQHDLPVESRNLVFNSALVMNGEGRGVVIRTGDNTMIGKIATLATATVQTQSSMEREVLHFVHLVAKIAVVTAIVFFVIGAARVPTREGIMSAFINGFIIVMVAFVPEGLPATVTSCLTIAAKRMSVKSVFIKRADIIETLGAATVICSDKTGTLTQNRMTVENVFVNGQVQNVRQAVKKSLHATHEYIAPDPVMAMAIGREVRVNEDGIAEAKPDRISRTRSRLSTGGSELGAAASRIEHYGSFYGSFSSFASLAGAPGSGMSRASWAKSSPYMRLVTMAGICNRARFSYAESEAEPARRNSATGTGGPAPPAFRAEPKILGDASDAALLRFVDSVVPIFELRSIAFPVLWELPFNSVNKYSMAVVKDPQSRPGTGTHVAMMKGAPEIILGRCSHYLHNGREKEIDDDFRQEHQAAYERFGFMGERVLGFAYKTFDGPREAAAYNKDETVVPRDGLVFLGLVSLVDPPRDGVAEAVAKCRAASVRVTMVTGDHPLTAEAIARKVGIITLPTAREVAAAEGVDEEDVPLADPRIRAVVRAGPQLRGLTEADWDALLTKDEVVFARTTPQQKLEIAEHYQRLGHVVTMTGDGVNDAPALKAANIGVAMGSPDASDVAREAADVVLMDDNFASIVNAIEEGRTLFDNLKKSIAYTITHTWPELFPVLINLWFGLPLPLPGLVILTIDLLTEQGPAVSFAYEKAEDSVMARPPRAMATDRLVSRQVLTYAYGIAGSATTLCCLFAYFMVYAYRGIGMGPLWLSAADFWRSDSADLVVGGRVFTAAEQVAIYHESVAAYYGTIVACQFLHVWVCKTRFVSVFKHGLLDNPITLGGCALGLTIAAFCIYVPGVQSIFFTSALYPAIWACSLVYGVFIWTYTELVKRAVREKPKGWVARNLAW